MSQLLQNVLRAKQPQAERPKISYDAADPDMAPMDAANAAYQTTGMESVAILQEWAETSDLAPGETLADRLQMLMVGLANEGIDGEMSDDEQEEYADAIASARDYLSEKGASSEDLDALFEDWDPDAAERVREMLATSLPDGDEATLTEMDNYVFGSDGQEAVFDSCGESKRMVMDAAYKRVMAVRNGERTMVKRRVAGHVVLSAAQKLALRKARMKANSAGAKQRRKRSNRMRSKFGLK